MNFVLSHIPGPLREKESVRERERQRYRVLERDTEKRGKREIGERE